MIENEIGGVTLCSHVLGRFTHTHTAPRWGERNKAAGCSEMLIKGLGLSFSWARRPPEATEGRLISCPRKGPDPAWGKFILVLSLSWARRPPKATVTGKWKKDCYAATHEGVQG